jgi:pyridoxal biosynthesis lyase PdxS
MGTIRGFICAIYTIAHIIQQQTVAVMTKVRCSRFVEGPLLQQILTHREAIIPTTTKIRVVIRKPMFDPDL